jgi:uncharacterized cupin superfamily protein
MLYSLLPGKRSPFTHRHTDAEEIYVVLSGSGRVKLDAFGAHHPGDGEPVEDPWTDR